MIVETRRMILRNFIRSDIDKYPRIRDAASHPHLPATETTVSHAEELARGYIAEAACEPRLSYQLAMLERADGRLVGSCGLRLHGPRARTAVLECEVAPDWRGQGLALEASVALLHIAFRDLELDYVSASVLPQNRGGLALAAALGMTSIDAGMSPEKRDLRTFGIAASDWQRPLS